MAMVRIKDAAAITRRSEKTLRAAILAGALKTMEGQWMGGREGKPGRVRWIDVDELRRWHEAHGGLAWRGEMVPPDSLEALAAEVRALRERVDRLERSGTVDRVAQGTRVEARHVLDVVEAVRPVQAGAIVPSVATVPTPPASSGYGLPAELVSLRDYGELHGASSNQVSTFTASRHLAPHIVHGAWRRMPRAKPVTLALGEDGRLAFHDIWGGFTDKPPAPWWRAAPDSCQWCADARSLERGNVATVPLRRAVGGSAHDATAASGAHISDMAE